MTYQRKTVDCWEIWVDYGSGYEHDTTEDTFWEMKINRRAYRENCPYPIKVKKKRYPRSECASDEDRRMRNAKARKEYRENTQARQHCRKG